MCSMPWHFGSVSWEIEAEGPPKATTLSLLAMFE